MVIFHAGKFQPGYRQFPSTWFVKLRMENGHFPGLEFSISGLKMAIFFWNSGWKMAIFKAWIFSNLGWKMAIFQAWIFEFGVENGYFPGPDLSKFSDKVLSICKNDIYSIKAPCERY